MTFIVGNNFNTSTPLYTVLNVEHRKISNSAYPTHEYLVVEDMTRQQIVFHKLTDEASCDSPIPMTVPYSAFLFPFAPSAVAETGQQANECDKCDYKKRK
jgi:hypothetical protein